MGKHIPVQTNCGITGDVLIEISNKTVTELLLPEIFYNFKKKLGCIFIENHNAEPIELKRGLTIGLVTSAYTAQPYLNRQRTFQERSLEQRDQLGREGTVIRAGGD